MLKRVFDPHDSCAVATQRVNLRPLPGAAEGNSQSAWQESAKQQGGSSFGTHPSRGGRRGASCWDVFSTVSEVVLK